MSQVQCPNCQSRIDVTERLAGRKVKCSCGATLRMPQLKSPAAPAPSRPSGSPIRFQCPKCATALQVKAGLAGKVARCNCGTKIRIPNQTGPPVTASAPPVVNSPLGADPFANQDPFAQAPFANQDPFANDGLMGVSSVGIDPLTGQPAGVPDVARPRAAQARTSRSGSSRKEAIARGRQKERAKQSDGGGAGQIGIGILMMVGAVVWLVAGLFAGYIFFYPPILFILGMVALVKGLMSL